MKGLESARGYPLLDENNYTARVKSDDLRHLEQLRAQDLFRWHCRQAYTECVVDGHRIFRLSAKRAAHIDRKGRRADTLCHPRNPGSIWVQVEGIRERCT